MALWDVSSLYLLGLQRQWGLFAAVPDSIVLGGYQTQEWANVDISNMITNMLGQTSVKALEMYRTSLSIA